MLALVLGVGPKPTGRLDSVYLDVYLDVTQFYYFSYYPMNCILVLYASAYVTELSASFLSVSDFDM